MAVSKQGFVLIPDRSLLNEVIAISEKVPGNKLQLDKEIQLPHLTVLQTHFKFGFDYKKALAELRTYKGFRFEPRTLLNGIALHETLAIDHILWWSVVNAEWLKTFNRELIETYKEWIITPNDDDPRDFFSLAEKESYMVTGYERNLDAYDPHFTLAVTDDKPMLPVTDFKGERARFHELAFVNHGEYGEITKILARVSLPVAWD